MWQFALQRWDGRCRLWPIDGYASRDLHQQESAAFARRTGIDRHLHDDFDDFLLGAANLPSAVDVDFEAQRYQFPLR